MHPLSEPPATPVASSGQAWRKRQRPAYHPEEGGADRSEWTSLVKAAVLIILLPVAVIALLLSH
ncbi:hypothetical protein E0493_00365 [Roseomonas sp. M0104]|uniref:Uncharacterized protein n=1 Tax=Teichococcus coralli TaxID=2545983 RepID=A0A845B3M5_9PROT|nr:hypothetical protein [Pseudoroseomonas coralli]MXP61801.1 hypothetical protein [Pseudoroseomonas coralli]